MKQEVLDSIKTSLVNCQVEVIAQRRCFETWFLGNRRVIKRNASKEFMDYLNHYDVRVNDPEDMTKMTDYVRSNSQFHSKYLVKMLNERGITYSKAKPNSICTKTYIDEVESRAKETEDIGTFKTFLDLVDKLSL